MNLNWSNKVIKYVLFVFNLLFVISGIIMIAVGVSVKEYYSDYDIFLNDSYFSLPNLLIAIGSLIFFISFFGCCGAIRESWFMIFIFSILLAIIFILEFSAGIAGYVLRDNTASYLEDVLSKSMSKYDFNKADNPNGQTKVWDLIQSKFHCCGAKAPEDWNNVNVVTMTSADSTKTTLTNPSTDPTSPSTATTTTTISSSSTSTQSSSTGTSSSATPQSEINRKSEVYSEHNHNDLPFSCCKSKPGSTGTVRCSLTDNTTATFYNKGCVTGFGDYLKEHAVTIGGVGIAIALIQLFGVIFACHLTKQLKHGFYST